MSDDPSTQLHRPRCCEDPQVEALWGLGKGDNNFITIMCSNCFTDLLTLDPPSGGDRGVYIGAWDWRQNA